MAITTHIGLSILPIRLIGSDIVSPTNVVEAEVKTTPNEAKALRGMVDDLKNKMGSAIVFLATANDEKVSLIAGVTKDLTNSVKAGELVNVVAQQVGGKGGGRPDMAQAGGSQPENLAAALETVKPWLEEKLG